MTLRDLEKYSSTRARLVRHTLARRAAENGYHLHRDHEAGGHVIERSLAVADLDDSEAIERQAHDIFRTLRRAGHRWLGDTERLPYHPLSGVHGAEAVYDELERLAKRDGRQLRIQSLETYGEDVWLLRHSGRVNA